MQKITLENIMNALLEFKNDVNKHLDNVDKRLTSLENTVTKIEHEHGDKLAAISAFIDVNNQKHVEYDKSIHKINLGLLNHDTRIDILEEKLPKAL